VSTAAFQPAATPPAELAAVLRAQGYAVLEPRGVAAWLGLPDVSSLDVLARDWHDLPPDEYLKDGGKYRRRRHACFRIEADATGEVVVPVAHRAHWQPVEYNALHGGMQRWFAPMQPSTLALHVWQHLLGRLAALAGDLRGPRPWFVEAHQFRIDTAAGIGRPTPEGAHRDGVDLVAVMLVARHGIKGGETRVFEAEGRRGERFTMTEPWTLMVLDDARVIHESTPIQPLGGPAEGGGGYRDTLVVTCRGGAFQGDDAAGFRAS
jgi:hypothetical protein